MLIFAEENCYMFDPNAGANVQVINFMPDASTIGMMFDKAAEVTKNQDCYVKISPDPGHLPESIGANTANVLVIGTWSDGRYYTKHIPSFNDREWFTSTYGDIAGYAKALKNLMAYATIHETDNTFVFSYDSEANTLTWVNEDDYKARFA